MLLPLLVLLWLSPCRQVTFRPYKKGGSSPQEGNLQFNGGPIIFVPINKKNRRVIQGPTETTAASILEVQLESGGEENVCRVLVRFVAVFAVCTCMHALSCTVEEGSPVPRHFPSENVW